MAERSARPTPFEAVFKPLAAERLPALRDALAADAVDPADRDAFLLHRGVVELIRELRPEQGFGEAMPELVALVHHAFLFWADGEPVIDLDERDLDRLRSAPTGPPATPELVVYYARFPARRIWGDVGGSGAHEPLDGCFIVRRGEQLALTAVFGFHPDRGAVTVAAIEGERPELRWRSDGTEPFAPLLPGGVDAGLLSLADMAELLELGWRTDTLVRAGAVAPDGTGRDDG